MVVGPRMKKKREPRLKIHDVKLRSVKTGQIIATGEVIDSGKTQGIVIAKIITDLAMFDFSVFLVFEK